MVKKAPTCNKKRVENYKYGKFWVSNDKNLQLDPRKKVTQKFQKEGGGGIYGVLL